MITRLNLFGSQPVYAVKEAQRKGTQPHLHIQLHHITNFFQLGIFSPAIQWNLVHTLVNVNEAHPLIYASKIACLRQRPPSLSRSV